MKKAFWVSNSDTSSGIYPLDGSHKLVRRLTLAANALDPADWYSIRLRAFRMLMLRFLCPTWVMSNLNYIYISS